MFFPFKLILSLLLLQLTFTSCADSLPSTPYCYRNQTVLSSYKTVTKTRIKTISPEGFFAKLKKKKTQVEIYEDQEPIFKIKVERYCCEGYQLSELDLCEPLCVQNGCPQNSKCVEPEVCECVSGYFSKRSEIDSKHYCEPICERPCPENGVCVAPNECACHKGYHAEEKQCIPFCASGCPYEGKCVAPNVCECQEGYRSAKGSCLPICTLGDQCRNGMCVEREKCMCNYGFYWNEETLKCEPSILEMISTTYEPDFTEFIDESTPDVETDIETSKDDIDPNQIFNEDIGSTLDYTEVTDEYGSSTHSSLHGHQKCPDDYVYHQGQCQPLKFASNEIDCWLKPCQDKNAKCLENGTCACNEGFTWYKTHIVDHETLNQTIKAVCMSLADYKEKQQQLKEDPQKNKVVESTNWATIFFTVFGVLIMMAALLFLGVQFFYRHRGNMNVEGMAMASSSANRGSSTEKSVI